ncbi:P-loop containing nucleoside triphosphate hydrolase protein [Rhizophagus diaphanus]|nr:P-loop containing nucleoside triphosphate hydrolase protein [Rhizophagus diaphanus] [Rhizophagus sp. MUCL 43196]
MYKVKVVLLGSTMIGKTSIMQRWIKRGSFSRNMGPTIGVAFQTKTVELSADQKIKLDIWDIAGQERFKSITENYYRHADVAIVKVPVIAIVGNKIDLIDNKTALTGSLERFELCSHSNSSYDVDDYVIKTVDLEIVKTYAQKNGLQFFETIANAETPLLKSVNKLINLCGIDKSSHGCQESNY